MTSNSAGSVTQWIGDLKSGDRGEASRLLWERYFDRLARLAQAHLHTRPGRCSDGEDVALSALDNFFKGVAAGRFPELGNRDDLWRLLVTITSRRAHNRRRDEYRQKRGGGLVIGENALVGAGSDSDAFLAQIVDDEPTPEMAAMVTDEYRRLFASLADESLRVVALLKLEGHTNEEVAVRLDCGLRTVERKLEVIRKRWSSETNL